MNEIEFKIYIEQYNDIKEGIKDLSNRIKEIEKQSKIVKDSVKGSSAEFPYVQHTCVIEGKEYNKRLERRKELLNKKKNELEIIKEQLEIYINTKINNERIRQILEYKYIDELTWNEIALKIKKGTPDSIRIEIKRFLKNL